MDRWHTRLALLIFSLFLLSAVDTLVSAVLDSGSHIRALCGRAEPINGKLRKNLDTDSLYQTANQGAAVDPNAILGYTTDAPFLTIHFAELRGRLWRGAIITPADAPTGDYFLVVHRKRTPADTERPGFTISLYETEEALRRSQDSLIERYFGVKPWLAAAGLLAPALASLYLCLRSAARRDEAMQTVGIGSVYSVHEGFGGLEVVFGLGERHGVKVGDRLTVLDAQNRPVADIIASKVGQEASWAVAGANVEIKPDYLVARAGSGSANREPR